MHVRQGMKLSLLLLVIFCSAKGWSQKEIVVYGIVKDQDNNEPVELVSVISEEFSKSVQTAVDGTYEISLPARHITSLQFRRTGFKPATFTIPPLKLSGNLYLTSRTDDILSPYFASKLPEEKLRSLIKSRFGRLRPS